MLISAGAARAQHTAQDALELGHQALERFRAGELEPALELFRRAEALAHSPVFALYIARSERDLGRLLDARRTYQSVADEALAEDAPEPWHLAQREARAELAELSTRIPSIIIEARFAATSVDIDGKPFSSTDLGKELELDPGSHTLTLGGPSGVAKESFVLRAGERGTRLSVDLPPAAPPQDSAAAAPGPSPTSETARRAANPNRTYLIPLSIGGAALVLGAAAGIVAITQLNDIKENCEGNHCPPEDEARMTPVRRWAAVSTAAFGVAAVGLTVGVALRFGASDPNPQAFGLRVSGNL
jgi:hypothetical protein